VNHEAVTPHSPNDSVRTAVALVTLPNDVRLLASAASASVAEARKLMSA
jgi:hypothetical protein